MAEAHSDYAKPKEMVKDTSVIQQYNKGLAFRWPLSTNHNLPILYFCLTREFMETCLYISQCFTFGSASTRSLTPDHRDLYDNDVGFLQYRLLMNEVFLKAWPVSRRPL